MCVCAFTSIFHWHCRLDLYNRAYISYVSRQMHINWAVNLLPATLSTVTQLFISQFLITFSFKCTPFYMNQNWKNEQNWTERKNERTKENGEHNRGRTYILFSHNVCHGNIWNVYSQKRMKWEFTFIWGYAWLLWLIVHTCDVICITLWCDRQSFITLIGCFCVHTHTLFISTKEIFASNQGKNINFVCTQSIFVFMFTHRIYCSLQCVVYIHVYVHECMYVYLFDENRHSDSQFNGFHFDIYSTLLCQGNKNVSSLSWHTLFDRITICLNHLIIPHT